MKNGKEVRQNGAMIIQRALGGYDVFFADGTASKGNPWDYLHNARKDADGAYPANKP